jgi:hypothetical protein
MCERWPLWHLTWKGCKISAGWQKQQECIRVHWQKKLPLWKLQDFLLLSIFGKIWSRVQRVRSSDRRSEVHQNYSYTLQYLKSGFQISKENWTWWSTSEVKWWIHHYFQVYSANEESRASQTSPKLSSSLLAMLRENRLCIRIVTRTQFWLELRTNLWVISGDLAVFFKLLFCINLCLYYILIYFKLYSNYPFVKSKSMFYFEWFVM